MKKDNNKETGQYILYGVINSFNNLISTIIGGSIGLTIGIVCIFYFILIL